MPGSRSPSPVPPQLTSRFPSSGSLQENLNQGLKAGNLDPKLVFHIRKIVTGHQNTNSITIDFLAESLRINHREYKRRYPDLQKFRQLVKAAFDSISQVQKASVHNKDSSGKSNTDTISDNNNNTKKRKWNEEKNEERLEREAIQIEAARTESGGGSMLNASLRQRYTEQNQKVGKERSTASDSEADNGLPTIVEEGANSEAPTPEKLKKKKKKRVVSASSTSRDVGSSSLNLTPTIPKERYADLGGMDKILTQIRELIEYPILHPELFRHLGVDPPRGVLLRGPPGVGKTHLANAVAGEVGVNFFNISAPEIIGGVSGESEARVSPKIILFHNHHDVF